MLQISPVSVRFHLDYEVGLGLNVHSSCGHVFISSVSEVGSVAIWNSKAEPEYQLCAGDRIDAINDVAGDKASILKNLERITGRTLKLMITKPEDPLTISMKKPMGLNVMVHGLNAYLHVKCEQKGFIKNWNDEHSGEQIGGGDRIISVSGVCGAATTLLEMMQASEEMDLTFLRYRQFDSSKLSSLRRSRQLRK